jgi:hypothetical protein
MMAVKADRELSEIVATPQSSGSLSGRLDRREQEAYQRTDDGDDCEQLDKR